MESPSSIRLTVRSKGSVVKYPAKQHAQRVGSKLKTPNVLVILQGEKTEYYPHSDLNKPFRQDRYFYYITGCNEPNCYVTYDVGRDKLTLWLPEVDMSRFFFDGRGSTIEEAMELYDVDEAVYIAGRRRNSNLTHLIERHSDAGHGCLFLGRKTDMIKKSMRMSLTRTSRQGFELYQAMNACRAIKDEHEIELIRKANEVTAKAQTNVMKQLHRLKSELEVAGIFEGTCVTAGARQAWPAICASGANAGTLHYADNDQDFGDRQLLLVDGGAEWANYASDVTRTMPINRSKPGHWYTKETEAVYKAVEKIQEACIAQLKPGKNYVEIAWLAVNMTTDALLDLGILKGDRQEISSSGVFSAFFPHGLGHHVGLEVHDVESPVGGRMRKASGDAVQSRNSHIPLSRFAEASPLFDVPAASPGLMRSGMRPTYNCLSSTAMNRALEANMVVTVEPGIYFNRYMLETYYLSNPQLSRFIDKDVLERYMHVGGVRIEDDLLITKNGCENLTTAPKGEEMLKVIREAAKHCER